MTYPQSISKILPGVINKLGLSQRIKEIEIVKDWPEIVGKAVAKHCRPAELNKKCLIVYVDSSPWLNELERYSKHKLLEKIKTKIGSNIVSKIKFRIGKID